MKEEEPADGKKMEDEGIGKENLAILEKIKKNQRQDYLNVRVPRRAGGLGLSLPRVQQWLPGPGVAAAEEAGTQQRSNWGSQVPPRHWCSCRELCGSPLLPAPHSAPWRSLLGCGLCSWAEVLVQLRGHRGSCCLGWHLWGKRSCCRGKEEDMGTLGGLGLRLD